MPAALVSIADAVVTLLDAELSFAATIERVLDPHRQMESLPTSSPLIDVLGRKSEATIEGRGGMRTIRYTIDVGIRQRIPAATMQSEHDELQEHVEEIMDVLAENPLSGRNETLVEVATAATGDSDWSIEDVRNGKVFVSVISATYLGGR